MIGTIRAISETDGDASTEATRAQWSWMLMTFAAIAIVWTVMMVLPSGSRDEGRSNVNTASTDQKDADAIDLEKLMSEMRKKSNYSHDATLSEALCQTTFESEMNLHPDPFEAYYKLWSSFHKILNTAQDQLSTQRLIENLNTTRALFGGSIALQPTLSRNSCQEMFNMEV